MRASGSDPNRAGHYYAYAEDYLEFARAVPFRDGGFYYKSGLQKADGSTNMFGRSVRLLEDSEYGLIVAAGFTAGDDERERFGTREGGGRGTGLELADRPIIERLSRRPFRDATRIKRAYDNTCAMSGLRIINGGGRAEAQAVHIRPVEANGPDSLRNGVALSSTFHWMFDRGMIYFTIGDDYGLLLKRDAIPRGVLGLVNRDGRLKVPEERAYWPHRRFLEWHRDEVLGG